MEARVGVVPLTLRPLWDLVSLRRRYVLVDHDIAALDLQRSSRPARREPALMFCSGSGVSVRVPRRRNLARVEIRHVRQIRAAICAKQPRQAFT
jgi:hypothetical protein